MENQAAKLFHRGASRRGLRRHACGILSLIVLLLGGAITASAQSWTQVTGTTFKDIEIGTTQLWALDTHGNPWQYNGSEFVEIPLPTNTSQTFASIAVGKGNTVWALGTAATGNIFQYVFPTKTNPTPKWKNPKGNFVQIASGASGTWAVNSQNQIYTWNGTSFVQPPNGEQSIKFKSVFVGAGVWAIDTKNNAYLYNTNTDFFDFVEGGTVSQIAVGTSEIWAVNSLNDVFEYQPSAFEWVPLQNSFLKQVAAGSSANIWGIDKSGEVDQYVATPIPIFQTILAQPPAPKEIRVSSGGLGVFVLSGGNVYQYVP